MAIAAQTLLQIEAEYRAGIKTLRAIGKDHGVSNTTVLNLAKKHAWTRGVEGLKRERVKAKISGAEGLLEGITDAIENEATQDAQDMNRGVRIARQVLLNMESAAETVKDPGEAKKVIEATSLAIDSLRKIRGLNDPPPAIKLQTWDDIYGDVPAA